MSPTLNTDHAIAAWYESQSEESLRDLQDRFDAQTPRQAWETFFSICLPPATNATGESLAAPAPGGQGVGTSLADFAAWLRAEHSRQIDIVSAGCFPGLLDDFDHAVDRMTRCHVALMLLADFGA